MRARWIAYPVWSLCIAGGAGLLSGIALALLGKPWRQSIGDVLFVEGAVILVLGGLCDLGRSITVGQIRRLVRPEEVLSRNERPGWTYILLIAGVLMCVQGVVAVRCFWPARG